MKVSFLCIVLYVFCVLNFHCSSVESTPVAPSESVNDYPPPPVKEARVLDSDYKPVEYFSKGSTYYHRDYARNGEYISFGTTGFIIPYRGKVMQYYLRDDGAFVVNERVLGWKVRSLRRIKFGNKLDALFFYEIHGVTKEVTDAIDRYCHDGASITLRFTDRDNYLKNLCKVNVDIGALNILGGALFVGDLSCHKNLRALRFVSADVVDAQDFTILEKLEMLELRITGKLPVYWGFLSELKSLRRLAIYTTQMTEEDYQYVFENDELVTLILNNGNVTDNAVKGLGELSDLRRLVLYDTSISNATLPAIGRLRKLEELNLTSVEKVDSDGIEALAHHPSLRHLVLSDTAVDDRAIKTLATLEKLRYLELIGTGVTESGLPALAKLKNLKTVYVDVDVSYRFRKASPHVMPGVVKHL